MSHFGVRPDPSAALVNALDALATVEERVPELYDEHGDLAATERAVREELIALSGYADAIESFEARFQTRGFLHSRGLLE